MLEAECVEVVNGPEDVAHFAMPRFRFEQREHFAVMLLNTKNHILGLHDVSVGSLQASVVHPREVFRTAVDYAAASMILLHNHPSGDPTPSHEDIAVTARLVKAGKIMDIPVLDHVIIGRNRYVSLKDKGLMS
jgi:DNA repair protein RadC